MGEERERKKRILIVDDEPDFVSALKDTLESEVCEASTTTTKKEAEQTVKTINPDLVIIGTLTPRGEAFSLHQWLRQSPKTKDLPIIVMDAPPEKQLIKGWRRDEALMMDAEEYVAKPIEPGSLATRAQTILEKETRRIKVLIVDDHSVVRDGIQSVLGLQKDIEVIGEAENGKEAIEKVGQLLPEMVIMDIVMPVMDGLEATKRIYEEYPQTRVLMLSQYDDEENILAAEQIGAYGFVPKRAASTQLVNGVRTIHYLGKRLQRPAPASN